MATMPDSKLRPKPWLPMQPCPSILFYNASVIDVEKGKIVSDCSIILSGGKITWMSANEAPALRKDVTKIDLHGAYICPGLIDCHVHLTATPGSTSIKDLFSVTPTTNAYRTTFTAKQMLLRGFTSARDTGGADASLREAIAEGLIPGPRLFIAGKALSQTGGHGDLREPHEGAEHQCCGGHQPALARVCDGVPACLQAVRDELRQGADFIKIMVGGGVASEADPLEMLQFTAEEIRAITTTAKQRQTYVTAHAYTTAAIRHAVDNGVMGIEHANFIDAQTAKYCADRGVVITPTLITYDGMTQPPFDRFLSPVSKAKNEQVLASGFQSLKILTDAGVTLCYGSDLLSGLHALQSGEFRLRAKVLSHKQILQSATVNAANLVGMKDRLGVIHEGAIADLLILSKNPLEDIEVLDQVEETLLAVIKDGRIVASRVDGLSVDDELYGGLTLGEKRRGRQSAGNNLPSSEGWLIVG